MKKKTYNLVFSKKNKFSKQYKNILTGRWVLGLNQKINDSNIEIYKYHWVDKEKKLKDFFYVQKIYKRVLKNLIPFLNNFHRKKFSKKNWELLLSSFLRDYIFFIYDRWRMIININKKYKLNKVEVFSFKKNDFIPQDTEEALYFLRTDEWDNWMISEIIKNQKLDFIEKIAATNTNKNKNKNKNNLKKLKIQKLIFPQNNKKYFLKDLMLPRYFKFMLNLKLGQTPWVYSDLIIEYDKKISTARKIFSSIQSKDKFEGFIYKMLPETFPKNYLENYTKIEQNLQFLNWPKNPKIIFTSFSHYLNDPFNIYTLNKLNDGSKLFILQHGHQYHNKFCNSLFEVRLCDKYLTWGNKAQGKNIVPLYTPTTIGKKIIKKNASGILLSIVGPPVKPYKQQDHPREIETCDIYKKNLFVFLNNLKKNIL
jgi:putative transferase (TIGR04331 family)